MSLPNLASADKTHGATRYAELRRNDRMLAARCTDCRHLGPRQLGAAVVLAARDAAPAFGIAVGTVVGGASQEQMIRVDAGRRVASMADKRARRDGAALVDPRQSMRLGDNSTPSQVSVSRRIKSAVPQHAAVGAGLGIVRETLRKRPISSTSCLSHDRGPFARSGQGRTSRYNASRPALSTRNCGVLQ